MRGQRSAREREIGSMLTLAVPVVLAEIGWMAMGVVDTLMVGRVGAEALGGAGVGRALSFSVLVFGVGLLLGLDTLVSHAHGAGRPVDGHRALFHAVYLALAVSLPMMLAIGSMAPLLASWGIDRGVAAQASPYLRAVSWSALPLLLYTAFRRYLQAVNRVRPVLFALVTANLVNMGGNWVLIYGNLGAPALGAAGAGWATVVAMAYMAAVLAVAIVLHDREERTGLWRTSGRLDPLLAQRLFGLGLPAALQLVLEVGAFALGTALVARLDAPSLAAHQVALVAASVTFMVPLGFSSAAAVRVGQALGRGDPAGARRAGFTALRLGGAFMLVAAVVFLAVPRTLLGLFTTEAAVVTAGVPLLWVAAFFQLSDGLQIVATGALRGAGDTRTPLVSNLVGHWLLGLPIGIFLCFRLEWGAVGLWAGWLIGLTAVAAALGLAWWRATLTFARPQAEHR